MTALALREDQDYWDDKQLAVLYQTGIGEDVTKPELASFLHECQQRKLDPFTRQIYLIGRYDKRVKRKVYRSQTGIDGFRLIARRAADRAGETIEYEDTIWFDSEGGRHEVWLRDEPPFACRVVALRGGKRFPAVARFSSYVQVNDDGRPLGLWHKMPDNQIEKCCEAKALRKAFPEELGGIYTDDEMAQADNPQTVQAVSVEVIREEPAPAEIDEEWLAEAPARASEFTAPDEGRRLWRETAAKASVRQITREDATRIQELIKARMEDLGREQQPAADPAGEAFARLDPDDAWTDRVKEIGDEEEARAVLLDLGEVGPDAAKGHLVRDAILSRWPGAADEQQEAA